MKTCNNFLKQNFNFFSFQQWKPREPQQGGKEPPRQVEHVRQGAGRTGAVVQRSHQEAGQDESSAIGCRNAAHLQKYEFAFDWIMFNSCRIEGNGIEAGRVMDGVRVL